jgi:hypothetical protein
MMISFGNITAHGVVYQFPEKPPQDLVWTDPKGHTNYWCSVVGDTSGSSSNPRTESRQTLPDSGEPYNWVAGDGYHSMLGTVRVELAPSSGKVIVGQIHAHKASNPYLMVTWWNGVARIDVRATPTGSSVKVLSVPCPLGQAFEYGVQVTSVGVETFLQIFLNDTYLALPVDELWKEFPFYFKAGAYVIDNAGPETEGGWVVYEKFDVLNA